MVGVGVLIVGFIGFGSWLFGYLFLIFVFGYFELLLIGEIELVMVMLFDFGVYFIVVGVVLLILFYFGKFSLMFEFVV